MTKKQLIQEIQKMEAEAFLKLKEATRDFGPTAIVTNEKRSAWCTLDNLMFSTGIQPDNTLPEQHAAVAIMKELQYERELQSNPNI